MNGSRSLIPAVLSPTSTGKRDTNFFERSFLSLLTLFPLLKSQVANATYPGYLIHEAVEFHPVERKWYFLPRKASTEQYHDVKDELQVAFSSASPLHNYPKGTNIMLVASEDFSVIEKRGIQVSLLSSLCHSAEVGPLEKEWGFTSVKFIPGTNDFIATKVPRIIPLLF